MNYKDIIQNVASFLDKPIPTTTQDLKTALIASESLRKPLLEARVTAQIDLAKKRSQYLHPKDRDFTNLDREIMLNANTTTETEYFELLLGLEGLLKDRHATLSSLLGPTLL